jgi:hypothetical protein
MPAQADEPFFFLQTDEGKTMLVNVNQVAWADLVSNQQICLHMTDGQPFTLHGPGAWAIFLAIAKRATDASGKLKLAEIIEQVEKEKEEGEKAKSGQ